MTADRVQVFPCPTCGDLLAGLLDACAKPDCIRADCADEAAWNRRDDR